MKPQEDQLLDLQAVRRYLQVEIEGAIESVRHPETAEVLDRLLQTLQDEVYGWGLEIEVIRLYQAVKNKEVEGEQGIEGND